MADHAVNPLLSWEKYPDPAAVNPIHFMAAAKCVIAEYVRIRKEVLAVATITWKNTISRIDMAKNKVH